ncbi:SDR family NAD(P)-dependent oxidoreductase [Spirosoma sp. HMF3257]|uniref:SDR family NAD(P)-dependent oxidoreductase n=1 Tax=Spirosoma telluris TaxID=2183553 RepID=A0A327NM68_9BACT|nr:SDR family NAD(P)-dependent oxidoreductase [Spirosoma telluris]RAI73698.1 SDR family NAD(P)-dependent oxidoreductase [Spirosoma telluris]
MAYALITGASRGIGLSIATELARQKFDLLLVARSSSSLQQAAQQLATDHGIKTDFLAIDLAEVDAAQQVYDWCSKKKYAIQILVNNAGYGLSGPFEKHPLAEHTNMMRVNMTALVELSYLFLPQLRQQPKSYILNIGSSAAYQAVPGLSLYSASKAFVLQFSRGLHQELRKSSVSVTCVCPGSTDTNFADRAQIGEKGRKAAEKVNMTPQDVAKQAVDAMFAGKAEVVTGFLNKAGKLMAWLLPKGLVEKTAGSIYE